MQWVCFLTFVLYSDFQTGAYTIKTSMSLGKLLLVKAEKDPFFLISEDEWYCSRIVVTTPEGDVVLFPCYRWISRGELVELRGGRGLLKNEMAIHYKLMMLTSLNVFQTMLYFAFDYFLFIYLKPFLYLTAMKVFEDDHPLLIDHRKNELLDKKKLYQ